MNNKLIATISVIVGLIFVYGSYIYATTPAGALPHMMPGFTEGLTKIHYKHAIASLLLGLALFAYAWFQTGPKTSAMQK